MRKGGKRRGRDKGDAMVFGDNVRARRAARALPRTPPTREIEEEEKEEKDKHETTHHTPPHFPTHNKHGNTKQKGNGNDTRETDNVKGDGTMQGAGPNPNTGTTRNPPLPPFNGTTTQTEGGHQHTDGERQHSTGRPATQPPFPHHATHHPLCHPTIHDGPTLHHDEGGGGQRIPHHTNSTDIHSPSTYHAPGEEQCTT